jgi:hypothetical protein
MITRGLQDGVGARAFDALVREQLAERCDLMGPLMPLGEPPDGAHHRHTPCTYHHVRRLLDLMEVGRRGGGVRILLGHAPLEGAAEGTAGRRLLVRAEQAQTLAAAAAGRCLVAADLGSLGRTTVDQEGSARLPPGGHEQDGGHIGQGI